MDSTVAPNPPGPLGIDRLVRRDAATAAARLGLCLETTALRLGPGPTTGREDATDPQTHQGVGTTGRVPLRGRDRSAAVPTVGGLLGATGGRRRGPTVRGQREARDLRRTQHLQRDTAVPGAGEAACRGFPGVPRADPRTLPRMACVASLVLDEDSSRSAKVSQR